MSKQKITANGAFILSLAFILLFGNTAIGQKKVIAIPVEPGVSFKLAVFRHAHIHDIQYTLNFDIPADKDQVIRGAETLGFTLDNVQQPLQVDFKQPKEQLKSITVNGKSLPVDFHDEHILINGSSLKKGRNQIGFVFIAGDGALNRHADFLYGLFVPDRARTFYPCFDQPDLKAKFLLTLQLPRGWKVLANAVKKDSVSGDNSTIFHFANSDLLPTYLFSFAAGKFKSTIKSVGKLNAEFLYREIDSAKIKLSVDSIFEAHKNAIRFLERWTGIPFPFQKTGFVAIPDFQYGGMEHPGEVQFRESFLFLNKGATKNQLIRRSSIISHETSHMWFGDMVTMKWFNDVWMKEVFANFMADKVTEKIMGTPTYNLRFLQLHYPNAYGVDRTMGANPIRQKLSNLQDAGSLYGNIIYEKAPIMMRQLEHLIGKENFRKGVDEYLKKYAYKNADWNDLIAILKMHTKKDLKSWNQVWVNQPGRPVFTYSEKDDNGLIKSFVIDQHPEFGAPRYWPQDFAITFVYADHSKSFPVSISGKSTALLKAKGLKAPLHIIFNSDGLGYGVFPLDKGLNDILYTIDEPLERISIYINSYENMLSGRVFTPKELLSTFLNGLAVEKSELNLKLLSSYIKSIYWEFITPTDREKLSGQVENAFWQAMLNQQTPSNKLIIFQGYQDTYTSAGAAKIIYDIWKNQKPPVGVSLYEDDYTALALTIALKTDTANIVIQEQRDRVGNVDSKARLTFLIPALSPDEKIRSRFFDGLSDLKNRRQQDWVVTALGYINHPLRQGQTMKYLPRSLEMLAEIQKTSDVFFPLDWMNAVFGNYQTKEAYQYVTDFLKKHPDYNPKLREKIRQQTIFIGPRMVWLNNLLKVD